MKERERENNLIFRVERRGADTFGGEFQKNCHHALIGWKRGSYGHAEISYKSNSSLLSPV